MATLIILLHGNHVICGGPDLEVWGSSLASRIVFLDKALYSTLPLFTQVYKWVPATYCWWITLG